jgi:hypothetical protein
MGAPERSSTLVGSRPYSETLDLAEKLSGDKHSSFFDIIDNVEDGVNSIKRLSSPVTNKLKFLYVASLSP